MTCFHEAIKALTAEDIEDPGSIEGTEGMDPEQMNEEVTEQIQVASEWLLKEYPFLAIAIEAKAEIALSIPYRTDCPVGVNLWIQVYKALYNREQQDVLRHKS